MTTEQDRRAAADLPLALMQARWALKDYHSKQPECGFDKLALACEMAFHRLTAQSGLVETCTSAAERLVNQEDEPDWSFGNYANRMNYWRDKAIEVSRALRADLTQ